MSLEIGTGSALGEVLRRQSDLSRLLAWAFPPGTVRRDLALEAGGNLIAAYIILLAACVVGVGDYTAKLRYNVLMMTVIFLVLIIVARLTFYIPLKLAQAVSGWLSRHDLRLGSVFTSAKYQSMRNLIRFLVLWSTFVLEGYQPLREGFKQLTGYDL